VNNNAAAIIEEKDLTGEALGNKMDELLSNKALLKEIGENAKRIAVTDATDRICDIVLGLIK
ncbi:MAG: UDP-N-acetylglucosamine--N-acetylmuramyl-(pentapeptide) pyrophosphoryl-undecaprenol N-acetylglucosamine transferase, partial [Oscillospiraceae bacterium]|nr:UDP-N-acetylglucosamine--N-acetylmuramyl-(pentapeptide) pyrophosphoryl-undecaprenol N-acetylglucosamine transferase [Oscillospiraceae bacterium]